MKKKKLLTDHQEEIMDLFNKSQEWKIITKLIDNNIVNLYQQIPLEAMRGWSNGELASHVKGVAFAIAELKRFKSSINDISKRVERRKEHAIRKKRKEELSRSVSRQQKKG